MRKHDVRKWLHAILDLLPVILIPVFMIYSHRHTIDSGSIDVPQNEVVDFNQQIDNYTSESAYYIGFDSYTYSINNDVVDINLIYDSSTDGGGQIQYSFNVIQEHTYYTSVLINADITENILISFGGGFQQGALNNVNSFTKLSTIGNFGTYYGSSSIRFGFDFNLTLEDVRLSFKDLMLIDLTQMFGSGNEPTLQQFNDWYSNDYYSYTLSNKQLLQVGNITFDDNDIMSQVVYQLYNSVDKYFNMGNVFNLTGVYDWFNLNIFNGNAPISIYIVWNIVLYEFVMDLLFLLYGLFMWFIDMVEKIMDKPFKSIK